MLMETIGDSKEEKNVTQRQGPRPSPASQKRLQNNGGETMTTPCKDCEFRQPCCWSKCEVYKMWKAEVHSAKKSAKEGRVAYEFLSDSYHKSQRKRHTK